MFTRLVLRYIPLFAIFFSSTPFCQAQSVHEREWFSDFEPGTYLLDADYWADTALVHHDVLQREERYRDLTEEDYAEVAAELGIDVAAIKAVVDIEAGKSHEGFWAPGKPLINFDASMYRVYAPKQGVSLRKVQKNHPIILSRPNTRRYGSYQRAQQARLDEAMAIDSVSAIQSTFWGMFQIGGFNWRMCGCDSIEQFVERMSRSERDQLELFARFIASDADRAPAGRDMLSALKRHNWLAFALRYNGPSARKRGYHTRMAAAYRRHTR